MTRYLVVAHQTATSPELIRAVADITKREPDATFGIVVPASPPSYWRSWDEWEALKAAQARAAEAKEALERAGATVARAAAGSRSPIDALADELRDGPGYDAIIVCTLPPGVSRWLKRDLPHQAEREFGLPVMHVIAARVPAHA